IRWQDDDPYDLAENLRGMSLYIASGDGSADKAGNCNGDPIEENVHEESVSFHQRLTALGIPHLWNDYGGGCHSWFYWQRDLRWWLPISMQRFAHPAPIPTTFSFRRASSSFAVHSWTVDVKHEAMEWTDLSV